MGRPKIDFDYVKNRVREVKAQRLVFVHNPRSSKALRVEKEILGPVRSEFEHDKEIKFLTYEVLPTNVDNNAAKLAKVLKDGDAVVVAGGDGTASIGMNGCMLSGKKVHFTAVPYGNFNDMARSLSKAPKDSKLYPIEAIIDGEHFRFAACYFTIGLFAESTEIFDGKDMRKNLQTGKKSMAYSVTQLAKWYFKNKKREFLPEFELIRDGKPVKKSRKASDYMAINGVSVAKMMRGGKWYLQKESFRSSTGKLTSFVKLCCFMTKSILHRVPGKQSAVDKVIFAQPATIEIQAEGEYKKLENVRELVFKKSKKCINIL